MEGRFMFKERSTQLSTEGAELKMGVLSNISGRHARGRASTSLVNRSHEGEESKLLGGQGTGEGRSVHLSSPIASVIRAAELIARADRSLK
jgi:hypothetical protein